MATVRWQPIIEDEEGNSWTPSLAKLDRIGDELFVTLSCSDAGFKAFCGKVGGDEQLYTRDVGDEEVGEKDPRSETGDANQSTTKRSARKQEFRAKKEASKSADEGAIASFSSAIAMADINASIEAVRPFIEDIVQQARQCQGSIVSLRDKTMKLLTQAGLVYEMHCASEHVLCHDKNRFGEGLVPARIVELFVAIMSVGFSFEETDPICFEIPNEGPRRKQLEVFNSQLAQRSEEILAPVVPDAAKLATVAGSHLSAGLRAVHFQMRWPATACNGKKSTAALMHDGKLNRNKIAETDANFGEAVGGMKYKVIRAQVEIAFPDLADLFQEVGNIGGHLHKGESYIAMLLKIHSRGVNAPRKHGNSIDWDLVQRLVLRSQRLVKREMTKQAAVLVNQILLEQAAVEVNREMTPLPSCLWGTTAMCWCHYSGDLS